MESTSVLSIKDQTSFKELIFSSLLNTRDLVPLPLRYFDFQGKKVLFDPNTLTVTPLSGLATTSRAFLNRVLPPVGNGFPGFLLPHVQLMLNVVNGCNYRCPYCLADEGGDYTKGFQQMNLEVACKAVDFIFNYGEEKGVEAIEIMYFGGEPLLNFPVVRQVTLYAQEKASQGGKILRLGINTNGSMHQPEVIQFLTEHMTNIGVSMDGDQSIQDRQRPRAGGKSSFLLTKTFIEKILQTASQKLYVSASIIPSLLQNDEALVDLAQFFLSLGVPRLIFNLVLSDPYNLYPLTDEGVLKFNRALGTFSQWYALEFQHTGRFPLLVFPFFRTLRNIFFGMKVRNEGCGTQGLTVDPAGHIYPSHFVQAYPEWVVGTVEQGYTHTAARRFAEYSATDYFEKCQTCWVKNLCGGACVHEGYHKKRSIAPPEDMFCAMMRHYIEKVLELITSLAPDRLEDLYSCLLSHRDYEE